MCVWSLAVLLSREIFDHQSITVLFLIYLPCLLFVEDYYQHSLGYIFLSIYLVVLGFFWTGLHILDPLTLTGAVPNVSSLILINLRLKEANFHCDLLLCFHNFHHLLFISWMLGRLYIHKFFIYLFYLWVSRYSGLFDQSSLSFDFTSTF